MRGLIDWRGRASSREFVITFVFSFMAAYGSALLFPPRDHALVTIGLSILLSIPVVGVITRRYHDFGSTGLFVAILFGINLVLLAAALTIRNKELRDVAQTLPVLYLVLHGLGLLKMYDRRPDPETNAFGEVPLDTPKRLLEPEPDWGDWDDEELYDDDWGDELGPDVAPGRRNPDA